LADGMNIAGAMPPAFRNHRAPTAWGTPAEAAASSLDAPAAIAAQNSLRSSRPAIGGRPGDGKGLRPDQSDRRLRVVIATSMVEVLRRPLESAQYCSLAYQAELRKHGILISMSGRGNCYDNAAVETFFKTLKSEMVWRTVFQSRAEAKDAIAGYIDGFYNPVRRHSTLDFISPAQFERQAA
jgi:putative transposase